MTLIHYFMLTLGFSLLITPSMGEQKGEPQQMKFDPTLPKPDPKIFTSKKTRKSPQVTANSVPVDWHQFYLSFKPFTRHLNATFLKGVDRQPTSIEDLNDRIWHSYFIAGAPLYKTDLNSSEPWLYDDDDILSKVNAAVFIMSLKPETASNTFDIPQEQIKQLNCIYFAAMMKTLRTAYFPDMEQKALKITENIFKEYQSDTAALNNKMNILNCMQRRSNAIKFYLDTSLEGGFLRMLVRYFPRKKGEVIKYLKMAGYEDHEMNNLIDRTVGRNPKTEFLYKGRPKNKK